MTPMQRYPGGRRSVRLCAGVSSWKRRCALACAGGTVAVSKVPRTRGELAGAYSS